MATKDGIGFDLFGSSSKNTLAMNRRAPLYGFSGSNRLTGNMANKITLDGFYLNYPSSGNALRGNTPNIGKEYGYYGGSTGSGTAGTSNFYTGDECSGNSLGGSNSSGLGTPQP